MIYAFDNMSLDWHHRHRHDPQVDLESNGKLEPRQYYPLTHDHDHDHSGISLTQQRVDVDALWTSYPISPLGSDLAPLPDLSLNAMDISEFLPPDSQVDSAWKEYTQLWHQVVEDPSLFDFGTLSSNTHVQGLEAEPTPPLDLEISPVVHFASDPTGQLQPSSISTSSPTVELVAPKPRRLINPAIHLAALVEEEVTNSVTASGPATAVNEDVQEVVPVQEEVQQMHEVIPLVAMYGHSMDQLREYNSDSDPSSEEFQPARFDMASSVPASSDSISFDDWSFPPAHLPSVGPLPYEPPSSPFHINPQWHPRTSQLREAIRERRTARHILQTHSRHSSLPDVQYRPAKWNPPMTFEPVHHRVVPTHRRERDMSYSVDWSAVPSQKMMLLPPPDDYSYHLAAPQYAAMPFYGNQPTHFHYGGQ